MTSEEVKCPIWSTPAQLLEKKDYENKCKFDSPRAGGGFVLLNSAKSLVSNLSDGQKARLTTYIVDQNRLGNNSPDINKDIVEQHKDTRPLTVRYRCDRFLMYIRKNTVKVSDGILIRDNKSDIVRAAFAWTECFDIRDLQFIIDYCVKKDLVQHAAPGAPVYQLTVSGYDRLDELDRGERSSKQAFIAMWFDASMNDAYTQGIEKAVQHAGYTALRIDQKEHVQKIDDEIIAEIRRSRFVVADFTAERDKPRGGVYFEAGFAWGLGIPIIWMCREDVIDCVHFDTRQFNHIVWGSPDDLRERLKNRIEAVIGDGPLKKRAASP